MEFNEIEYGLDVSNLESDSVNGIKLLFAKDGFEANEFVDPKIVKVLTIMCRNSERIPEELSLFTNLKTLSIGGGNFNEVGIEFPDLKFLENILFMSPNLTSFPIPLLKLESIKYLSIIGNLYTIKLPKELCEIRKNIGMYFLGTQIDDEFDCFKNNSNLYML